MTYSNRSIRTIIGSVTFAAIASIALTACGSPVVRGTPERYLNTRESQPAQLSTETVAGVVTEVATEVATEAVSVAVTSTPTAQVVEAATEQATAQVAIQPTDSMNMTEMPTQPAPVVTVVPGATSYVLLSELFGSPTPTGSSSDASTTQASTPESTVDASASVGTTPTIAPSTAPAEAATLPLATLPPTATRAAAGSSDAAGASGSALVGNAQNGAQLFMGLGGCSACHDIQTGNRIVGPSLKGVASRAGSREPGLTAEQYLAESIMNPNKFVVTEFTPGLMPQTFQQTLSKQQIADLVAYLMTLK